VVSADEDGAGPALRQRLYAKTFLIHPRQAICIVGEQTLVGRGGQIIVPAFTPHTFAKTRRDRFASTPIHVNSATTSAWR